ALGSSARDILYVVLREGNVFGLAGVAIGLLLISRGAPLVRQFLQYPEGDMYSVELYLPAAIFFFAVAFVAALVPAWRATRIDPVDALRCE
ncbi:MAG: FtsX-like permease family protein, partial [Gemmatimonadaceae bacterium]